MNQININKVTLGNDGENDEVIFRDRSNKSFVMFCSGIKDLNEDFRKIRKCDVEQLVCRNAGKCEIYED